MRTAEKNVALIRKTVRTVTTTPATPNITLILSELVWTLTIAESHRLRHLFSSTHSHIHPPPHTHTCLHTYKHLQTYVHSFAHKNANSSHLHVTNISHFHTLTQTDILYSVLLCLNTNAAVL